LKVDACRQAFQAALQQGDGRAAARSASHLIELEAPPANPFALGPERELIGSAAFTTESEVIFTTRIPGLRAFTLIRELVGRGVAFTVTVREDGREKRIAVSEAQLSLQGSADDVTPSIGRYLRRLGSITEADLKAATATAEQEKIPVATALAQAGKLSEEDWFTG